MSPFRTILARVITVAVSLLSVALSQGTQAPRYWVFFADKPVLDASMTPSSLGITERALRRRAKVLPPDQLIDANDLHVRSEYRRAVEVQGIRVVGESRWLNALSVEATTAQLEQVRLFSFVRRVEEIGRSRHERVEPERFISGSSLSKVQTSSTINYGTSITQLSNIAVPQVHALGIVGSGTLVGMIDNGFNNHKTHNALKNIPVLKEYDWIQADSNTSKEGNDSFDQGDHGCFTMSALAGFDNGNLVGPAFGVSMILAKSEYNPTETQIELDNYVLALEWMEREGCDVVSTSLGYDDLDPARQVNAGDILYSMKDGNTAVTSKAARAAARKGLLLVTAMGNENWWRYNDSWQLVNGQTGSLITPADADSIVAVGAVYSFGEIASFSSTGPTSDGRIKPEVVAQGVSVKSANPNNLSGYVLVSGTSLSTPLTAGVAALVVSAHPELTPMQVREALMATATHPVDSDPSHTASWPNNFYGSGMVNALEAVLYHGLVFSNRPLIRTEIALPDTFFVISTWIKSKYSFVADSLRLYYKRPADGTYQSVVLQPVIGKDEFYARIRKGDIDTTSICYFNARDVSGKSRKSPYNAPDSSFSVTPTPDSILSTMPESSVPVVPEQYILYQNYPNPFNASTTILFSLPQREPIELTVFDLFGRRVKTLAEGTFPAGSSAQGWNGTNDRGQVVATGLYFYRLKTSSHIVSGKMLFVK